MAERHNTLVCTFDPTSPRITACDIHEWIHQGQRIPEHTVRMIQIIGAKRQVYIQMTNNVYVQALIGKQMNKPNTSITTEYYRYSTEQRLGWALNAFVSPTYRLK